MRFDFRDMAGAEVCAGAHLGHGVLMKLLAEVVQEPRAAVLVFLDFKEVEIATASFLRESVLAFRNFVRPQRSNYYPLVANANAQIREELKMLLELQTDALLICDLDNAGRASNVQLLGRLEGKQYQAYELVRERVETDATQLQSEFGEREGVKQTAWNNRLSALAASGLVIETSQGRGKRYRAISSEVVSGC